MPSFLAGVFLKSILSDCRKASVCAVVKSLKILSSCAWVAAPPNTTQTTATSSRWKFMDGSEQRQGRLLGQKLHKCFHFPVKAQDELPNHAVGDAAVAIEL